MNVYECLYGTSELVIRIHRKKHRLHMCDDDSDETITMLGLLTTGDVRVIQILKPTENTHRFDLSCEIFNGGSRAL